MASALAIANTNKQRWRGAIRYLLRFSIHYQIRNFISQLRTVGKIAELAVWRSLSKIHSYRLHFRRFCPPGRYRTFKQRRNNIKSVHTTYLLERVIKIKEMNSPQQILFHLKFVTLVTFLQIVVVVVVVVGFHGDSSSSLVFEETDVARRYHFPVAGRGEKLIKNLVNY